MLPPEDEVPADPPVVACGMLAIAKNELASIIRGVCRALAIAAAIARRDEAPNRHAATAATATLGGTRGGACIADA